MVVAHPDDEFIFAGNAICEQSGWRVVCVTNKENKVRRTEFEKVMKKAHVEQYEMWNYEDKWKGDFPREQLKEDLTKILQEGNYSMVVSHGRDGEYGHTQHKALGEVLYELVNENLYEFSIGTKLGFWKRLRKWYILFGYKSERRVVLSKEVRNYVTSEELVKIK